jgi:hypothetical protein
MSNPGQAIVEHIAALFAEFARDGEARLGDFLEELEGDLADLWTVPLERQPRYLRRMELQALALLEVQRIETINTTKQGLARAITLGLRLALRVLTP